MDNIQTFLTIEQNNSEPFNVFTCDLCKTMVCDNIPWNKLCNPSFRGFLEKYCSRPIPSESTVRKDYLNHVYNDTIDKI